MMIVAVVYVVLMHLAIGYMYVCALERRVEENMSWVGTLVWLLGWPLILPVTMIADALAHRRLKKREEDMIAALEKFAEKYKAQAAAANENAGPANAGNTTVN